MRYWFVTRRQDTEVSMRTQDLLDSFPCEPETTDGEYIFSTVQTGRLFRTRYEWSVSESGDGSFHITEQGYISRTWYILVALSLTGTSLGYVGVEVLHGTAAVASYAVTSLSTLLFCGTFIVFAWLESPVHNLFDQGTNYRLLSPLATLLPPVFPLLFVVLAFDLPYRLVGFGGIVGLLAAYAWFHSWIVIKSFRWQSWFISITHQIPLIAGNYVAGIGLGGMILGIFIITHDAGLFRTFSARWPVLFPAVFSLVPLLLVGLIGRTIFHAWGIETDSFEREGRNIDSVGTIAVTTVGVVAASAGFGYLSYRFLGAAASLLTVRSSLGMYGYVLLSGIPVWYFATGLLYQVFRFFAGVVILLRKAERRDLAHVLDVDAETYVLDHQGIYAGAVSLLRDHIIVSQGIVDSLPEEQVAVILAHEEGHLKQRDTVIGVLITVLSPLVLTAKNVLYGVMDFRSKEFQADQYAASRVENRQQLYDALDSLQQLKAEGAADDVPSVTPTLLSFDSGENTDTFSLNRLFGFYFGEFAMSRVHPSLAERKDRVR